MRLIPLLALLFLSAVVVAQPKYNQDSATMNYQLPDSVRATQLYVSLAGSGRSNAFYGLAFDKGRIGFQLRAKKKSFVFFIPANGIILARGIGVDSMARGIFRWKYNWQEGRHYPLLLTTISDSGSRSTIYTGYVFLPEKNQWKLLASYKSTEGAGFILAPAALIVKGRKKEGNSLLSVEQSWVQRRNGSWKQLTDQTFDNPSGIFSLTSDTGNLVIVAGKNSTNASTPNTFSPAIRKAPVLTVTNHVDSLVQTKIDKKEIIRAVAKGRIDTTGSVNDVYYKILTPGTGRLVQVSDTLNVYYKGWLLKNEQVFDQTKDKPVNFPLARLIKGWQIGLTQCRVGGKIRLFIPSGLAYSIRSRSKDIPPNSVLVFDVEVLDAKPAL
jgi:FKBP-type peptidyl-prolyl cis-trans isomerase FkpA